MCHLQEARSRRSRWKPHAIPYYMAIGLIENNWIIALIVIFGAIANWLTQRRQQQQKRDTHSESSPDRKTPKPVFDLEEALRRMMGEAPETPVAPPPLRRPSPPPPPPPVGRPARSVEMPAWTRESERRRVHVRPVMPSQPEVTAELESKATELVESVHGILSRYDIKSAPPMQRAVASENQGLSNRASGWNWRSRGGARQAFIASVVFGPPKGLES